MALESSVRGGVDDDDYMLMADAEVDDLRRAIWRTIHAEKGDLSWADVLFTLGIVQYEVVHHIDEF